MKKTLLKKLFGMFLLLVTVGALFFCAFLTGVPMGDDVHTMPSEQNMPMTHSVHLGELTLATTTKISLATELLVVVIVFALLANLREWGRVLEKVLLTYVRQKFYDILYIVRQTIQHWLALLEVSPTISYIAP